MTNPSIFTIGGTVQAGGGIYLPRPADDELLQHCQAGDFSYVLTARQMGKSSLMVRTAERLNEAGTRTAVIDLTRLGTSLQAEQWYLGLVDELVEQLDLDLDYKAWWQTHAHLGATQRLSRFLREVAIEADDSPLVIFIDEIDTTLSLAFSDDFFAAIRACYNARGTDPAYKRLSFVLLGVATPGDLIRDPQRTPFNIGQRIDLTDFSLEQALPLADGFGLPHEQAQQVLAWVLNWTGGHPYLTQRLCRTLLERNQSEWDEDAVAKVVEETFFGERSKQDGNLQFVRDMLTRRAPDVRKVLRTYQKVREGKPVKNEEQSLVVAHLKISGVVHEQDGLLILRNRIYERAFDLEWVRQSMPSVVPVRIAWAASVSFVITLLVAGYFGYQEYTRTDAERAARYKSDFESAQTAQDQLASLVDLLSLDESLYTVQARTLFNRLPVDERLAIFEPSTSRRVQKLQHELTDELFYFLSDTEENNAVLTSISLAMGEQNSYISDQVDAWLAGREALAKKDFATAEDLLSAALRLNSANPGVLYDRARAFIGQGDVYYPSALNDLEEVIQRSKDWDSREWITPTRTLVYSSSGLLAHWENYQGGYPVLAEAIINPEVLIPGGEFSMGGSAQVALAECQKYYDSCDTASYQDEEPVHTVELSEFTIDQFEVTNARYEECVTTGVCSPPSSNVSYTRDSYYGDPAFIDYPVINVSWFDANTYCEWRGARLPTEAEWEYAARGGLDGMNYPWGDVFEDGGANFCDTNCDFVSALTTIDDGFGDTSPVGSYLPNDFGLYDMAGNVWEWVADWYAADYYQKSPSINPLGPETGDTRVLRGGSWLNVENLLRVSLRGWLTPGLSDYGIGFRCAR